MKISHEAAERIAEQLGGADLGDPRRSKRLERVVAKLARDPAASVPSALESDAEVQGAYRLMNNPRVTLESVLEPHIQATRQNAEAASQVLLLHDTTDCSFPTLDPEEIGYLATGKAGFRLHLALAVDGKIWRRPLGVAYAETLSRAKPQRKSRKPSGRETMARADRESARWWRGIKTSGESLVRCKQVIHVADRESDSYELMWQAKEAKQDFIFRVRVDRRGRAADCEGEPWSTVKKVAAACQGLLEREVELSHRKKKGAPGMNRGHPPRKGRIATLQFAATTVLIPRPQYLHEPVPKHLELNLVHVVEDHPPTGEAGVEWLLYTTLPVATRDQVEDVVDKYRSRWLIEEFNAALKTGCAYEEREFESLHALLTMLALSLPIACELLWLRSRARTRPDDPATDVLTPLQIRVLEEFGSRKMSGAPTVQEALLSVAGLGGHLKRNGPPGWKVLYRGMLKLTSYAQGWAAALRHGNL